ncbi:MAG: hypothetical protein HDQ97_18670 [Lachnospiraceae bacterium]|nr:hypothetical protein [Lachnospiraceae bacterium]
MQKKVKILAILIMSLYLMACTNEITEETNDIQETRQNPEQDAKIEVVNVIVPAYEISDEETIVDYEGDFFRKSVFCTGGEMIYICGIDPIDGSYFIGGMPKEGNRISKFPVEIPESMRVFGMTVDSQERCHLLLMSTEKIKINDEELDQITYETSDIWIIDKEGTLEKKIDVSEVFATEQRRPFCLAIDYEGNYYFESHEEMIKLCPDGNADMRLSCGGEIEAIGGGRSGKIYYIYRNEDGIDMLGMLQEDSTADIQIELPDVGTQYSLLTAGTDTELFIYNIDGGIYTYELDADTVELRLPISELPVSGEAAVNSGFLGDGRLCLMVYEGEKIVFIIFR